MKERKHGPSSKPPELVTMVFDDEGEYVRFTDYVYEKFSGVGLEFTNAPIIPSVRVTPQLLANTQEAFRMRPLTDEDLAKAKEQFKGHRAFDPETIRGLHVPGIRKSTEPTE